MGISRIGIQIGGFTIHFYGLIIMFGVIVAVLMTSRLAKKNGQDPEIVWDILPWVLIGGIIGARLWHILTPSPTLVAQGITTLYYLTHPIDAISIWNGGLGILGGVAGGWVALYIFVRRRKLNFFQWTDFIVPGLALAQAIGRWGNFVNQELYGAPTTLPWGIYIDPAHRYPGFENFSYYHPTFFYESVLNIINMAVLLWIGNRFSDRLKNGDVTLVYLIIYPMIRFFMEFLRLDSSTVGGININQILMLIIAVAAALILYFRHNAPFKKATDQQVLSEQNSDE